MLKCEDLGEQITKMHDFYSMMSEAEVRLWRVFSPEKTLPVAALYDEDNKWYRAEIVQIIPNTGNVEVVFVDYGNTQVITSTRKIRYLSSDFIGHIVQVRVFHI